MNKKILTLSAVSALLLFLAIGATGQGPSYTPGTTISSSKQFAAGVLIGNEWGFALTGQDFPRDFSADYYNLDTGEKIEFFVKDPNNNAKNIIQVYVGDVKVWNAGSYFGIKGESVYSDFPEQKFYVDDLVKKHGGSSVYDKKLDYYFPSEDRKIFKIEIEVDTSRWLGEELILHKVHLLEPQTFLQDLAYMKDNGKVPVDGTPGELKAVLNADPKTGNKPLEVTFDISKSTHSTGSQFEKYLLDFGDDSNVGGDWPTDAAGLNALKSIKHTYNESATATAILSVTETPFKISTTSVDITIGVSDKCGECDTILKCLACIDKRFVENVFE